MDTRNRETQSNSKDRTLKESRFLEKLVEFLKTPVATYKKNFAPSSNITPPHLTLSFDREAKLLKHFWLKYKNERQFSHRDESEKFAQIFQGLVDLRICDSFWIENANAENTLHAFQCLRVFLRDRFFQREFDRINGYAAINLFLLRHCEQHIQMTCDVITNDILKEVTNVCQKLSAEETQRYNMVAHGLHKWMVLLLSSTDVVILHLSLYTLIGITKHEESMLAVSELNCIEVLIQITSDYDVVSKQLAVTLLRQLCVFPANREHVKVFHGIPVLLSLLRSDALKLLWSVVLILVQLSEDSDTSNEIRLLGGIPLLIALLQERQYVDEKEKGLTCPDVPVEQKLSLKAAVCTALTELVLNDTNARCVVQANGIFVILVLIFPGVNRVNIIAENQLQKNAFRTLRFLFSMERNRQLFKRLFPAKLFEMFIDVGHYERDLDRYQALVKQVNSLTEDEFYEMQERIQTTNQNKAPSSYIQNYAVYEHLGSGAFGSVYKVKRKDAQSFLAMKQISAHHPDFGKGKERHENIGSLINECAFVKKQLNHPNIVRYHKAFLEGEKLIIIMDLVDGAPLGEHFNSLKEKQELFSEERLWHIFIQMVLALRYIHKEMFIVHRDLTPNNIMLSENDKVTITDFGLARQKHPDASKLTSMVGTILYSCPEIVRGIPYGEKADIWGIGCILYQMATLEPPFYSSNMLSLATKIVEARYEPLDGNTYSHRVPLLINRCLTVQPDERPDILQVASLIPDVLIKHMEEFRSQTSNTERKLEKEKKRVQKHTDQLKNQRITEVFAGDTSMTPPPKQERNNSGSYDSTDDELFRKPRLPPPSKRRLLPLDGLSLRSSSRKVSAPDIIDSQRDNMKRTNSCSYLDNLKLNMEKTPPKFRPISAQATLSISPRKVREINDPILQMLTQLHKVLFITQLPPALKFDANRRVVEQYKRSLFSSPSSAPNLKNELKKLLEGSKEQVDVQIDSSLTQLNAPFAHIDSNGHLSYEELKLILETVLQKEGYYAPPNSTKPLASIMTSSRSVYNEGIT